MGQIKVHQLLNHIFFYQLFDFLLNVNYPSDYEEFENLIWYAFCIIIRCYLTLNILNKRQNSFDMLLERNVSAIKNVSAVASSLDSLSCCK